MARPPPKPWERLSLGDERASDPVARPLGTPWERAGTAENAQQGHVGVAPQPIASGIAQAPLGSSGTYGGLSSTYGAPGQLGYGGGQLGYGGGQPGYGSSLYGSSYSAPYSAPYGGSSFLTGGPYGGGGYGGGAYGGGAYGGGSAYPYRQSFFGGGPDPSQLPDMLGGGLRNLENAMFTFGRITQLFEMNLEAILRFVGSLGAFADRMRSVSGDFSMLTSSVRRQSIEFGERSLARLRQIRLNRKRLLYGLLLLFAFVLRWRVRPRGPRRHPQRAALMPLTPASLVQPRGGPKGSDLADVWHALRPP